jgi:HK97 family phage major capsid protein
LNLAHLQETRASKIAEMRAATGNPEQFDKLEGEVRALDRDIKRAATLAEFERQADAQPDAHAERELRNYSVARAIQGQLSGKLDGIEGEMHAELSKGRESRGVMIPTSVLLETRDQTVGTSTAGGYTVATNLGGLIDRLRPTLAVQGLGATILSGLTGFLDLPKLTGGPTAYWIGEDANTTESASTFGMLSMSPHTVSGEMQLSRRLMLQNAVALESVLRSDLGFVLAQALDKAAIAGTGTGGQPTGILTQIAQDGTANTSIELVAADLIAALEIDDVSGTSGFLTNPKLMSRARKRVDTNTRSVPISETFYDENVVATNQVASISTKEPLIYGHWSDLVIGYWSGVDVLLNPYHVDVASKGGVKLHAFLDADIAIRHDEAFAWKAV